MSHKIAKALVVTGFLLVMIPGFLVSWHLDQLQENMFVNFSVVFTMLLFGFMTLETLRKISINENIDFNQNKIEIIQSSFVLMDGNDPIQPNYGDDYEISAMDNVPFAMAKSQSNNPPTQQV